MVIILLGRLLHQSITQAEQLSEQGDALRLLELQNNQALNQKIHEQQRLLEVIKTLEVPIIPLATNIIVVPLVGALDSMRMQAIQKKVLEAIYTRRSSIVILDMTGVSILDTDIANKLIELAQAIDLLGAQAALTGMRSEIASALVQTGTNLRQITSYASIQSVLETSMQTQRRQPQ